MLHPGSGSEGRLAALREAGYVEGQNLVIEPRHAQGRVERLPALARELVGLKPDIILATTVTAAGTLAAKRMELLKMALPRVRRVVLLDWPRPDRTSSAPQVQEAQLAARSLTLETVLVEVREGSYERAFSAVSAECADALFVLSHPILHRDACAAA